MQQMSYNYSESIVTDLDHYRGTCLDLTYKGITDSHVPSIMEFLEENPNIIVLNLKSNSMGNEGLIYFVKNNTTITEIMFTDNKIDDQGIEEFAKLNKKVRNINFSGNPITDLGIIAFAKNNRTVSTALFYCEDISIIGQKALASNLELKNFETGQNSHEANLIKIECDPTKRVAYGRSVGIPVVPSLQTLTAFFIHNQINKDALITEGVEELKANSNLAGLVKYSKP